MMKDSLEDILKDYNSILKQNDEVDEEIADINKRVDNRIRVCEQTERILEEAERDFSRLTSILNKKDIPFFVFSVILQCGVKYVIKILREMSDKELADKTPFHSEEKSNRISNKYYASREEISSNPVPFDVIQKEHETKWYKENGEIRPGFNGFNHRATALGHDPLLGLLFGTANIMTSTITRNDFVSWHVDTRAHLRTSRNGSEYFANLDTICERASTVEIFRQIASRLENEGKEGWITLGCAFLKEIVHLMSDLPSKQSLPIPLVSTYSPKLARELSMYGLSTGSIVQGGFATVLINWAIGFLHGLTKSKDEDVRLFKVRTRKIIMFSDMFASVSDLGYTAFIAYMGDKNAMRKFDLGGYLVTLYQICHSNNVIAEIEREFFTKRIIEQFKSADNNG